MTRLFRDGVLFVLGLLLAAGIASAQATGELAGLGHPQRAFGQLAQP